MDDPEPTAPARRSRGVEWETFYVPARAGLLVAGDNVLAVEVRPSGDELVPRLDLEVRAVENSRIVRGPLIQRVTDTSAVVIFETDLPTRGAVEVFAEDGNTEAHVTARGALAVRHRVRLEGLTPATVVRYRVRAGASVTEGFSFHTAPRVGAVVRFAVYGDMRGGHRVHESITSRVLDEAPDFVVVTGDLVVRGTDEGDWQRFFSVARKLLASGGYYPVAGNHDVGRAGDEQRRMNEIFELWPAPADRPEWGHWYSFDVADVHFVMLDSNSYEHIEQLRWLEDDLKRARARGVRAIFAATHDGPYSRGLHRGNRYMAEHYAPVLAKAKVALIFSGHDHLYQRGAVNGLDYMVSGGGGAPLYSVRCGAPGRSRCAVDDGMKKVLSEHHYITVAVYSRHIEACVRRPDRTLIEPCWKKRL